MGSPEKTQTFDVCSLRPGLSDLEVTVELADFFNRISSEFDPLLPEEIPTTMPRTLKRLELHEVANRIRRFRKPRLMVSGDFFPDLVMKFADFLALPLTSIFNDIASSGV